MNPAIGRCATAMLRAFRRRCPACGKAGISKHWVQVSSLCPQCGLDIDRHPGSFVGGVGINTITTFGLLVVAFGGGLIASGGRPTVLGVLAPTICIALVAPLAFYARSRLLWVAFELVAMETDPSPRPEGPDRNNLGKS